MNRLDKDYQQLLQDIIEFGVDKMDRTGTGCRSLFGYTIRHNMRNGFPLLTTKKMHWPSIVSELLWFLKGDTNIKWLLEQNNNIWNGDAYKHYVICTPNPPGTPARLTQEEFINKIKTDNEFAKQWGELGPIYGRQWRSWKINLIDPNTMEFVPPVDQISNLINDLKTNPDSRRLMVNAWNVGELDQMILPPCHFSFQCYSYEKDGKRYLSLAWNQRSVDTFLGLPFNIASYGLLLEMIAKEVNMVPDQLIGNLGDVHLYSNHIEQAKEQIDREPMKLPSIEISEVDILKGSVDVELKNYLHHSPIKAPLSN